MGSYREQTLHAKAVRAGIIDAAPVRGKSKRPTPVVLYAFAKFSWREKPGYWMKIGEYRDETTALVVAGQHARKHGFYLRFRIGRDGAEFDPRTENETP